MMESNENTEPPQLIIESKDNPNSSHAIMESGDNSDPPISVMEPNRDPEVPVAPPNPPIDRSTLMELQRQINRYKKIFRVVHIVGITLASIFIAILIVTLSLNVVELDEKQQAAAQFLLICLIIGLIILIICLCGYQQESKCIIRSSIVLGLVYVVSDIVTILSSPDDQSHRILMAHIPVVFMVMSYNLYNLINRRRDLEKKLNRDLTT